MKKKIYRGSGSTPPPAPKEGKMKEYIKIRKNAKKEIEEKIRESVREACSSILERVRQCYEEDKKNTIALGVGIEYGEERITIYYETYLFD